MYGFLLFFGGVVVGVIIEHFFFKKPATEDPDGEIKQQISDKLTSIKKDLQQTI